MKKIIYAIILMLVLSVFTDVAIAKERFILVVKDEMNIMWVLDTESIVVKNNLIYAKIIMEPTTFEGRRDAYQEAGPEYENAYYSIFEIVFNKKGHEQLIKESVFNKNRKIIIFNNYDFDMSNFVDNSKYSTNKKIRDCVFANIKK